ncbi:MAG: response regulator transcription factor [Planctomycetota bacterium]|nr:response regulator transcription factor [Planctomycetota bacterium]
METAIQCPGRLTGLLYRFVTCLAKSNPGESRLMEIGYHVICCPRNGPDRFTMMTPNKILLVEDDFELSKMVVEFLSPYGFDVATEGNGDLAVERILAEDPAAVILDINLPGRDGFEVCRAIRAKYQGAIIFLTARGDEIDEVVGLEIGADDFMAKPVRPHALLARLRTHIRRAQAEESSTEQCRIELDNLMIDSSSRQCILRGREIELTTAEFDLIWLLAKNAGKVLSRSDLYYELNGFKYDGLDRSIDLRVSRLRKKLHDDSNNPQLVKSVRGVGYMLTVSQ